MYSVDLQSLAAEPVVFSDKYSVHCRVKCRACVNCKLSGKDVVLYGSILAA